MISRRHNFSPTLGAHAPGSPPAKPIAPAAPCARALRSFSVLFGQDLRRISRTLCEVAVRGNSAMGFVDPPPRPAART